MRSLKKRVRPDNLPNERRVARGSVGRLVYLILLGIFFAAVLNRETLLLEKCGQLLCDYFSQVKTPYHISVLQKQTSPL